MQYIYVGKGLMTAVDDCDFERVNLHKWNCAQGYVNARFDGKTIKLHRFLMGQPPQKGLYCDHIDGDRLNNQRSNLRWCTPQQNVLNRRVSKRSGTGLKGVKKTKEGNYQARITFNGKQLTLGTFKSPLKASEVYENKAKELFGEFYRHG